MAITTYTANKLPYVVIISAARGMDANEDAANNAELFHILWNWKTLGIIDEFRSACGYYKGTREASYIVTFQDRGLIESLAILGSWFKQECILVREFMANGLPVVHLLDTTHGATYMDEYLVFYGERTRIGRNLFKVGHQDTLKVLPDACTIIDGNVWTVA
jgi:hypothetical protein